jgi:DNA-binding IclR family transcriptional regulator
MPPSLLDLRPTHAALLRAVAHDGSVRSLARSLGWSPAQVHQYLTRLAEWGLVRSNERTWLVTPTGQAVTRGLTHAEAAYVRETTGEVENRQGRA